MSARKFRPLLLEVASRKGTVESPPSRAMGRPAPVAPPATAAPPTLPARGFADGTRAAPPCEPASGADTVLPALDAEPQPAGASAGSPGGLLDAFIAFGQWLSSLTEWRAQAVAGCVLLVVLAFAFFAGRMYERVVSTGAAPQKTAQVGQDSSGESPATPPAEPARVVLVEPRDPAPTESGEASTGANEVPEAPAAPPADGPRQVALERGYHYLTIQFFPRSKRADAEKAAAYLTQNGVPCALLDRARDIQLLATEPFLITQNDASQAKRERARADELNRRVREIGKAYQPIGGYDFRHGQLTEIR